MLILRVLLEKKHYKGCSVVEVISEDQSTYERFHFHINDELKKLRLKNPDTLFETKLDGSTVEIQKILYSWGRKWRETIVIYCLK